MDPEAGSFKESGSKRSDGTPPRRATIGTVHENPLPLMTVHDAIEAIWDTGNGVWAVRLLSALSMGGCMVALETVMGSYLASCVHQSFHIESTGEAFVAGATQAGCFLGSLVLSPLADVYGRRQVLMWSTVGITFFCLMSAASPTFNIFFFCRFLCGFCEGSFHVSTTLMTEFVPIKRRGMLVNCVCGISWSVGTVLLNLAAWLVIPHYGWRALLIITAIPIGLNVFQLYMLVESPRWLMSQGRIDAAFEALEYMAKGNGTVLPCSWLIASQTSSHESTPLAGSTTSSAFKRVFTEYQLLFGGAQQLLLCTLLVTWSCMQFSYLAVVLLDNDVLGEKKGLDSCQFDYSFNTFLATAEVVGSIVVIPLLDWPDFSPWLSGRVGTQTVSMFVSVIAIILTGCNIFPMALWAYMSRGLISGVVGIQILQAAELFDAQWRATGVGFLSAIGVLASAAAPFLVFSVYSRQVVSSCVALMVFITMMLTLWIPETAGQQLDGGKYNGLKGVPELPWLSSTDERIPGQRRSEPCILSDRI